MWAVEKYIGHWDGYAGVEEGPHLPHNYYLCSDPSGRFQMLPWGTDQTWEAPIPFDESDGLMFELCLEDEPCLAIFRKAVASALAQFEGGGLTQLAIQTAALLEPWQAIDPRKPYNEMTIDEAVAETELFIASRPAEAAAWLEGRPSAPGAPASEPPASIASVSTGLARRISSAARVTGGNGALRTRLRLLRSARISPEATPKIRKGEVDACSEQAQASEPGALTLHCVLSDAVRERLRARWLRITVVTRLRADDGATEVFTRRITLPRS